MRRQDHQERRAMSLVDIAATATACEHLAPWWQDFTGGGGALYQLEAARRSLQRLAPQPGPVGRAVTLIATGGWGATGERLISAMNLLARVAAWRPPPDAVRSTSRNSRHRPPPR